jgi:hypothetical protein
MTIIFRVVNVPHQRPPSSESFDLCPEHFAVFFTDLERETKNP